MKSSENHKRLAPLSPYLRSIPEEFAFTQLMYETQRRAFMNEQSLQDPSFQSPGPRKSSPGNLASNSPRRTNRSLEFPAPRPVNKRCLRYSDQLSSLTKKCSETQELPNISVKVNKGKLLLRRYSRRMDWAMNTLQQNLDLDYDVIVPLFEYFTREKFELEMAAKQAANQLKNSKN